MVDDGRRPRHHRARHGHRRDRDRTSADAVVLATGGYGNVFFLSTNAMGCNVTATWRAHRKGAYFAQPLLHADPPDLHPGVGRLPVQAHADERVAAQRRPHLGAEEGRRRPSRRARSPRTSATTTSSASTRRSATWCPRDIASRAAKYVCDDGQGRRSRRPRRLPRLRRRHRAPRPPGRRGQVRQPLRHVRADHRRGPVHDADAHLPGRALHDGRPVGRLRPAEQPDRACSSPARPTSPTTAPTASAPAR